jgi:hypothetical protein
LGQTTLGVSSFLTNLVELIKTSIELEEELEDFEGFFDKDDIVDM